MAQKTEKNWRVNMIFIDSLSSSFFPGMSTQYCHVFKESERILVFLGPNWPVLSPGE